MYCGEISMCLARKAFLNIFFILLSSSAMSFASENSVKIVSDNKDCMPADYEGILTRIENFASYQEIDDHIVWSNIWSKWLFNRKPLDMTISAESPEIPKEDELKRSKVWMAFSPFELPSSLHGVYPQIPLICSISEKEEGTVIHRCDQIKEGRAYAVQSFSSMLQISRHDCGVTSFFEIVFNLKREEVNAIYTSIINHYRWPEGVLRVMERLDENELFSLYFQNLYNQLLLL